MKALEEANTVDLDQRSSEWRADGWDYAAPTDDLDDADMVYGTRETELGGTRYRSYASDTSTRRSDV